MKIKIDLKKILKKLEDKNHKILGKKVNAFSLSKAGFTRAESEAFFKGADLSLDVNKLFTLSEIMDYHNPVALVSDISELTRQIVNIDDETIPEIQELDQSGEPIIDQHSLSYENSLEPLLLKRIDSVDLKCRVESFSKINCQYSYMVQNMRMNPNKLSSATREEKEAYYYHRNTHWVERNWGRKIWKSLLDPECLQRNRFEISSLEISIDEFLDADYKSYTAEDGSLKSLLESTEMSVQADKINLLTEGKDYRIFYTEIRQDVLVTEESEGLFNVTASDADQSFKTRFENSMYRFKYRPGFRRPVFIIAPIELEFIIFHYHPHLCEHNIFNLQRLETPRFSSLELYAQFCERKTEDDNEIEKYF